MNAWNKDNTDPDAIRARQLAEVAFAQKLHLDRQLRARCLADPALARQTFALCGEYYIEGEEIPGQPPRDPANPLTEMPGDTVFRVFEKDDTTSRDKYVLMVLPTTPAGQALPNLKPGEVWTCTWQPYLNRLFSEGE